MKNNPLNNPLNNPNANNSGNSFDNKKESEALYYIKEEVEGKTLVLNPSISELAKIEIPKILNNSLSEFSNNASYTGLDASGAHSNLTAKGLRTITTIVDHAQNLKKLNLSTALKSINDLNTISTFFRAVGESGTITDIDLSHNSLDITSSSFLLPALKAMIGGNSHIEHLDLSYNSNFSYDFHNTKMSIGTVQFLNNILVLKDALMENKNLVSINFEGSLRESDSNIILDEFIKSPDQHPNLTNINFLEPTEDIFKGVINVSKAANSIKYSLPSATKQVSSMLVFTSLLDSTQDFLSEPTSLPSKPFTRHEILWFKESERKANQIPTLLIFNKKPTMFGKAKIKLTELNNKIAKNNNNITLDVQDIKELSLLKSSLFFDLPDHVEKEFNSSMHSMVKHSLIDMAITQDLLNNSIHDEKDEIDTLNGIFSSSKKAIANCIEAFIKDFYAKFDDLKNDKKNNKGDLELEIEKVLFDKKAMRDLFIKSFSDLKLDGKIVMQVYSYLTKFQNHVFNIAKDIVLKKSETSISDAAKHIAEKILEPISFMLNEIYQNLLLNKSLANLCDIELLENKEFYKFLYDTIEKIAAETNTGVEANLESNFEAKVEATNNIETTFQTAKVVLDGEIKEGKQEIPQDDAAESKVIVAGLQEDIINACFQVSPSNDFLNSAMSFNNHNQSVNTVTTLGDTSTTDNA